MALPLSLLGNKSGACPVLDINLCKHIHCLLESPAKDSENLRERLGGYRNTGWVAPQDLYVEIGNIRELQLLPRTRERTWTAHRRPAGEVGTHDAFKIAQHVSHPSVPLQQSNKREPGPTEVIFRELSLPLEENHPNAIGTRVQRHFVTFNLPLNQ